MATAEPRVMSGDSHRVSLPGRGNVNVGWRRGDRDRGLVNDLFEEIISGSVVFGFSKIK